MTEVDRAESGLFVTEDLQFNSGRDRAVRRISFILERGSSVWLKGPSGEGKTTLLRSLARLTAPVGGDMRLEGVSYQAIPAATWRARAAYLHQKPVMFPGSVKANLQRAFTLRERDKATVDLDRARSRLDRLMLPPDILDRDALTLSVGEGLRVALVRSLLVDPLVLLLDEPTAALDSAARDRLASLLAEWVSSGNRGIIGVSHDDEFIMRLPGKRISLSDLERVDNSSRK